MTLRDEYLRRSKEVFEASERSNAMERDFLATKVLNAEANAAMIDLGHKQRNFAEWLLKNHEALFAVSESTQTFAVAIAGIEKLKGDGMKSEFFNAIWELTYHGGRSDLR